MEPTDHNRRAFDDAHRTAENVLATPGMPERIRERLHGADGNRVLHLLCGTGGSRSSSTELGALVTGVDDDEAAIDAARHRHPEVPWVHADVHVLPPELLLGRWDLVYLGSARSAACGRSTPWAAGVASALRPGGVLLLHDEHPAAACLDAFGRWRGDYSLGPGSWRARRRGHQRRACPARPRGVAGQGIRRSRSISCSAARSRC